MVFCSFCLVTQLSAMTGIAYPIAQDTAMFERNDGNLEVGFNSVKLKRATQSKYIGLGCVAVGGVLAQSEPDAAVLLLSAGGLTAFISTIVQDIQLVRLGRDRQKREPRLVSRSRGESGVRLGCADAALTMGDRVSFKGLNGETFVGEIVGLIPSQILSSGCQVIVRYSVNGKYNTKSLSPDGLKVL